MERPTGPRPRRSDRVQRDGVPMWDAGRPAPIAASKRPCVVPDTALQRADRQTDDVGVPGGVCRGPRRPAAVPPWRPSRPSTTAPRAGGPSRTTRPSAGPTAPAYEAGSAAAGEQTGHEDLRHAPVQRFLPGRAWPRELAARVSWSGWRGPPPGDEARSAALLPTPPGASRAPRDAIPRQGAPGASRSTCASSARASSGARDDAACAAARASRYSAWRTA